jgi:hypothetical protein
MPIHSNPSIYLSEDYATALKHDLNKSIRLNYDNGMAKRRRAKRNQNFSNVIEATNFIAGNVLNRLFANKRLANCRIDLKSL